MATNEASGYSGTPLAKKLGIKDGFKIKIINAPDYYFGLFTDLPSNLSIIEDSSDKVNFIHFFADNTADLLERMKHLRNDIFQDGIIWISWPKKASKVETDLDGNLVRDIGLNNGLVDIKVCAIDTVWSGLKFVIPVKDRTA